MVNTRTSCLSPDHQAQQPMSSVGIRFSHERRVLRLRCSPCELELQAAQLLQLVLRQIVQNAMDFMARYCPANFGLDCNTMQARTWNRPF